MGRQCGNGCGGYLWCMMSVVVVASGGGGDISAT